MNNIRHSSGSPQWGTPFEVITIASQVLGVSQLMRDVEVGLTVDPFSEPEFNRHVGARRILTGEAGLDGYRDRWLVDDDCPRADAILADYPVQHTPATASTAIVNPPGDESGENTKRAWKLLVNYWTLGWLDSAMWVAFNLNQFQTLQRVTSYSPLSDNFMYLRCVPSRRLDFTRHSSAPTTKIDKKTGKEVAVDDAPSHPMFFMLLGSHEPAIKAEQLRLFDSMASKLGEVF